MVIEMLFPFLGILGTQLIHCTWEFGSSSLLCLVMANNIGRGMLFLFVTYLGYWAYKNRNKSYKNILILGIVYITWFFLNVIMEFITEKSVGLKNTVLQFVRGTPGDIWIIYGLLVFCVLLLLHDKITNSKIKKIIKIIGGGGIR